MYYSFVHTEIVRSGIATAEESRNEEDKSIVGCRVVGKRD